MMVRCGFVVLACAGLVGPVEARDAIGPAPPRPVVQAPRIRPLFRPVLTILPPSRIAALGPEPTALPPPLASPPSRPPISSSALAFAATPPSLTLPLPEPAPVVPAPPPEAVSETREGQRSRGRHRDMAAMANTHPEIDRLIAIHAKANNVPEAMVHRIVVRESRYNPRAVGKGGAMGLMQIKHATARGLGYAGPPDGLLDADTNLRYAVPYLAGAYRTANGNADQTVAYYASGYYYAAKRKGLAARPSVLTPADTDGLTQAQRAAAARPSIFSIFTGTAKPMDPDKVSGRLD